MAVKNKTSKTAAPKKAAVKKEVPVKTTAPKKAAVKKEVPVKTAAPKKAEAKKEVPVKTAAPKKAAAKKEVPVKTASPKKAAVKKEVPVKTAAPKKAAAKKEVPVKTASPKKAAVKKEVPVKTAAPKKAKINEETTAKKSSLKKPTEPKSETKGKKVISKPNVRYSNADLEEFKIKILEMKAEAIDELRMLRERLDDLNNFDFAEESMIYSMHMAEQGSEAMEKEKTYAQIQRINEYIKKLDEALERIKLKTYGVCRVCHCLIAKERLLAVPVTTLSASYKIHKRCPEDGLDRIEPVKN